MLDWNVSSFYIYLFLLQAHTIEYIANTNVCTGDLGLKEWNVLKLKDYKLVFLLEQKFLENLEQLGKF